MDTSDVIALLNPTGTSRVQQGPSTGPCNDTIQKNTAIIAAVGVAALVGVASALVTYYVTTTTTMKKRKEKNEEKNKEFIYLES